MLDNWLPFLIYAIFALAIPASMMWFSFVFATRPHKRTRWRELPFESGVSTGAPRAQRFTVSFYLTAMLFIVFDIEIVFLYPLAVILHQLAWFGFLEFLFFIAILVIAYVYVWRKGALDWQEKTARSSATTGCKANGCSGRPRGRPCSSRKSTRSSRRSA